MNENRSYKRSPVELAASYGISEENFNQIGAKVHDVSVGGFCFSSEKNLKLGKVIDLVIELESSKQVQIPVKVVWVREEGGFFRVGVEIIQSKGEDFERFYRYYVDLTKNTN